MDIKTPKVFDIEVARIARLNGITYEQTSNYMKSAFCQYMLIYKKPTKENNFEKF